MTENTPDDETGKDVCGVVFANEGCTTNDPKREWTVELPSTTKPPISEPAYPTVGHLYFKQHAVLLI